MTDAEVRAAIANAGETRSAAEFDEIVIDGVSIPVRSVQRTDTSRFEGKVTFGDYTMDSDQLMSTWLQSTWVGGMLIDDHTEGATDSRFRYARAWTMSSRQLTLPLATNAVTLTYTADADVTIDIITAIVSDITGGGDGAGRPYRPWLWDPKATLPLGSRQEIIFAACGRHISAVNTATLAVTSIGDLDNMPVNTGAWYDDGAGNLALWVPQGPYGLQWYDPYSPAMGVQDATIPALALLAHDTRLYALTWDSTTGESRLRYRVPAGTWDAATNPAMALPPDEVPRNLVEYFDRAGNPAVCVVTMRQAFVFDEEAEALVPLGLRYPFSRRAGQSSAVWRDDGLYVSAGLGINRMSQAGVRTAMGLDRDDGYGDPVMVDGLAATWADKPAIRAMVGAENYLVAAVSGFTADGITRHDILGWNEAGWHHISTAEADGTGQTFVPHGVIVADALDTYQIVTGERCDGYDAPTDTPKLYITAVPENFHAPKALIGQEEISFAGSGVLYTGWFDAGMRNFTKAWSQVEIYLRDPEDGTAAPPGSVTVSYRTEADPSTWVLMGTADAYNQNVLPFGTIDADGVAHGLTSLKIELKIELAHADGVGPHTTTPIVEAISLKFIKLAQYGSAWQIYVPLSDFELWHGLGPTQIDAFLSAMTSEGTSQGPFSRMIHRRTADGEPGVYRIRAAQWQRAEATGNNPRGDGVINVIAVPIQEIDG